MIDKRSTEMFLVLEGVADGAIVMVGGFGAVGQPNPLIEALIDHGACNLTNFR